MNDLRMVVDSIIPQALKLLPGEMDTPAARAMLIAIGLQESKLKYRRQIGGPARGLWQFERGGGVRGVLNHPATKTIITRILLDMGLATYPQASYETLEHNDVLACVFARLLLWTHPASLPAKDDPEAGWVYYTSTWRPGKPHRETWDDFYRQAWSEV